MQADGELSLKVYRRPLRYSHERLLWSSYARRFWFSEGLLGRCNGRPCLQMWLYRDLRELQQALRGCTRMKAACICDWREQHTTKRSLSRSTAQKQALFIDVDRLLPNFTLLLLST